jgi:hypothetical protein
MNIDNIIKKICLSTSDGTITRYNFIFILWGFLTLLEFFYIFLDMKYRPIGEIFAYVSPEIITQSQPNSLYPVILSSRFDQTVSMIMLICFMLMSLYSGLLFLVYLTSKIKNFFR